LLCFYDSLVFPIYKIYYFFYFFGIHASEDAFTWFSVTDTSSCHAQTTLHQCIARSVNHVISYVYDGVIRQLQIFPKGVTRPSTHNLNNRI